MYWSKKGIPSHIQNFETEDYKLAIPPPKSIQTQKIRVSKGRKRLWEENNFHPCLLNFRTKSPESDESSQIPRYGCDIDDTPNTYSASTGIILEQQKYLIEHSTYICNGIESAVA